MRRIRKNYGKNIKKNMKTKKAETYKVHAEYRENRNKLREACKTDLERRSGKNSMCLW